MVVDNRPHLDEHGVEYLARGADRLWIVMTDQAHPAFGLRERYPEIVLLPYADAVDPVDPVDPVDLFVRLGDEHGVARMTVQTGGELTAVLLRAGLIDSISIVVAPCLVGGRTTATLVDGEPLRTSADLADIRPLTLTGCSTLEDSYLRLDYQVRN